MALTPCRQCDKLIHDRAITCPHCSYRDKKLQKEASKEGHAIAITPKEEKQPTTNTKQPEGKYCPCCGKPTDETQIPQQVAPRQGLTVQDGANVGCGIIMLPIGIIIVIIILVIAFIGFLNLIH